MQLLKNYQGNRVYPWFRHLFGIGLLEICKKKKMTAVAATAAAAAAAATAHTKAAQEIEWKIPCVVSCCVVLCCVFFFFRFNR